MKSYDEDRTEPLLPTALAAALDQMPEALVIATVADSPLAECILYVNPAFVRLSGYAAEELLGHSTLLLAGARPDWRHAREIRAASNETTFFAVARKYRPDGTAYDVELWRSPLRDASGEVTHFLPRQRELILQKAVA